VFLHPTCEVLSKVLSCLFSGSPCKRNGGNPCKNNGRCEEDTLGNFRCFCEGRFTGTAPVLCLRKQEWYVHCESIVGQGSLCEICVLDYGDNLNRDTKRPNAPEVLCAAYIF
jgi:hypothetical protein